MALSLINNNASDRLVEALCNTLMHSLWQGILLAAIAGLAIICTRKASSALRYNLLIGVLVLFAAGVSATFVWQYQKGAGSIVMQHIGHSFNTGNLVVINNNPVNRVRPVAPVMQPMPARQLSFTDRVSGFMNNHHNTIVLIWFLIICARSLQLGFGLYGTYRLRHVRVFAIENHWPGRMQQLAEALGMRQTMTLLESGLARVPMVIGHLKPVVLVPVGLLTALSPEEVEAILIHELAHIKRRDYLVNMLQSLMEIIFFFNPAVLWVSGLIKTERENCCDDLAIAQNNNKINYIRALVSCEEYQASMPAYAMGLLGGKNTLLHRVKRMVSNKNYSLNLFEKTVLAICLVVLGLGVSAFTAREDIKKAVNKVVAAIHHDARPEAKAKAGKGDTTKKKQVEPNNEVNQLLNKLIQLHPDTLKNINSPEIKALIFKVDSLKFNTQQPGLNANLSGLQGGNFQLLNMQQKPDTLLTKLLDNNNKANQKLLLNLKPDTNLLKKFRELNPAAKHALNVMDAIGRELYQERLITDTNNLNIMLNEKELIVNGVRMSAQVHERIYRKYGRKGENGSYTSNYGQQRYQQKSEQIAYELLKENLVKDPGRFTYKLSRDEFSIDGEKQPDELRRRIIDEFFKPDDNFNIDYIFHDPGSVKSPYADPNVNAYANSAADYSANASRYGLNDSQQRYWARQQTKIIDQMKREGLITGRRDLSFTLTDKSFVINGVAQRPEVFQRYRQQYVPANAGNNWDWSYNGPTTGNPNDTNDRSNWRSRDWDAYSKQMAADRQRIEAERDKELVADLLQDGLITDPNNVTFTLSNKKLEINGTKESDEIYKKYKDKYIPDNGNGDWSWTYSHHK